MEAVVEEYVEYLSAVRGLSRNTVISYRRDLLLYAGYIHEEDLDWREMSTSQVLSKERV